MTVTGRVEAETDAIYRYQLLYAAIGMGFSDVAAVPETRRAELADVARKQVDQQVRVLSSARAAEVTVPVAAVDTAVKAVRMRYSDDVAWREDLARNGLDEAMLRLALRCELQCTAILRQVSEAGASIGSEAVTAYYCAQQQRFTRPEQRKVRHILVTINTTLADNDNDLAYHRITELAARLAGCPDAFADEFARLAQRYSECPSGLHGGLIGTVPRGRLYSCLDAVLFGQEKNTLSSPVQSEIGWHLLWCEDIFPEQVMPLASVKDKIRDHLTQQARKNAQAAWLASLP